MKIVATLILFLVNSNQLMANEIIQSSLKYQYKKIVGNCNVTKNVLFEKLKDFDENLSSSALVNSDRFDAYLRKDSYVGEYYTYLAPYMFDEGKLLVGPNLDCWSYYNLSLRENGKYFKQWEACLIKNNNKLPKVSREVIDCFSQAK